MGAARSAPGGVAVAVAVAVGAGVEGCVVMRRRHAVHPRGRRGAPSRPWTIVALLLGLFVMHGITTTAPAAAAEHQRPMPSASMESGASTPPCHPDSHGHLPAHAHCVAVVSKAVTPSGPDLATAPAASPGMSPVLNLPPRGSAVDPSSRPRPPTLSDLCLLRI